jgi:hypothetical protein
MPEQTFFDDAQQLIVRLSEDTLVYAPAAGGGWQCRVPEIAWTSAERTPRGIHHVNLHAADGRVVAAIPWFEQIERFYVQLFRLLAGRPCFDPVRESMPAHVEQQERALWLATQTCDTDGVWEAMRIGENAAAIATASGLVLMPSREPTLERLPWQELAGFRSRRDTTRFYRADSYLEVPLGELGEQFHTVVTRRREELLAAGVELPHYQIPGVNCPDEELAMTFSWEIEEVRDDHLVEPDETIVACAVGPGRGRLFPDLGPPVEPPRLLGVSRETEASQVEAELFLTDRRLLHVERDPATRDVLRRDDLRLDLIPKIRRSGSTLILGKLEVQPRGDHPGDMAEEFMTRYRQLVTRHFNPFTPETEVPAPQPRPRPNAGKGGDPFAPELEG